MKKIFLFLFFISLFQIGFSQKSDSSQTPKIKLTGIFISAGLNVTQYNSNAFFSYLTNNMGTENLAFPIANYYSVVSGSVIPNQITYTNLINGPVLNTGLIVNTGRFKNLFWNHKLEISYVQVSNNFSYLINYAEVSDYQITRHDISDTFQFRYKQQILSIGYKFQPTYKFMFLSFGVHCSFNLVKVNEYKKERIIGSSYNENTGKTTTDTSNNVSYNSTNMHFINVPFEVGIGGIIHINRISLEPAFYFTPCLSNGYNFYNLSLEILFNPRKK